MIYTVTSDESLYPVGYGKPNADKALSEHLLKRSFLQDQCVVLNYNIKKSCSDLIDNKEDKYEFYR